MNSIELNIFIDISKSEYKSNFYKIYKKENVDVALLLLSNNEFKYLGIVNAPNYKPFMVNLIQNINKEDDFVVFGIIYPSLMQDEVVDTDKLINWSDVLFTQEVTINSSH